MKKGKELIPVIQNVYFKGQYNPSSHYIAENSILHTAALAGIGGEQKLNDANSKVETGISDFNGTQIPNDAKGLLRAMIVRYGKLSKTTYTTLIAAKDALGLATYSALKSEFPAWLLNSEIVIKTAGLEALRMRVSEFVVSQQPDKVGSDWAKEFERTIKTTGGQDIELFLNTPKNASASTTDWDLVQITLYGIKFGERKGF